MKQRTRTNRFPERREQDETDIRRSPTEAGGFIAGVLVVLLLVLAVWFGVGIQSSGTGLDVDVPAAPTEESVPSD
ncbi:MAG: hypothetical protein WD156_05860 [Acidimicrobiia bacterium]